MDNRKRIGRQAELALAARPTWRTAGRPTTSRRSSTMSIRRPATCAPPPPTGRLLIRGHRLQRARASSSATRPSSARTTRRARLADDAADAFEGKQRAHVVGPGSWSQIRGCFIMAAPPPSAFARRAAAAGRTSVSIFKERKASDVIAALGPLAAALEVLGVRYFLGGSLAGAARGIARGRA